jgi:hypothetical protein
MRKLHPFHYVTLVIVVFLICFGRTSLAEADTSGNSAAWALRIKLTELAPQLNNSPYQRPIYLESTDTATDLKGEIFALVDAPLSVVSAALQDSVHWCDVLILHLNIKYCHASHGGEGDHIGVKIGRKSTDSMESAYAIDFSFDARASTPDYLDVLLKAATGPLGTRNYRIKLEAVAAHENKTFLHLTYSYSYNFVGQMALKSYLATAGRNKVGFSIQGKLPSNEPLYIGGVRGMVERNTMRYYLAIDAYLQALSASANEQFEKRIQSWFTSTELYPRQLHEIERSTYIDMKRTENQRMQMPPLLR